MRQSNEIRRRHDGSIDTEYYARIGRVHHGLAVRALVGSIWRFSLMIVLMSVLIGIAVRAAVA